MSAPLYALMVLVSWLVLGALLVGVARLVRRAFHWRSTDILGDVWVGYGATLAALQLWHLVAPIGPGAFVVFSIAGGAGLLLTGARPGRLRARLRGGAFALSFLLALVLALRALSVAAIYDTGLYHLSSVRWLMEAPIVPGLGNLHGRLAFNNSSFLWNALVKAGPWDALAIHVGQGTLLLPLIVRSGFGAARLIFR
ncbi:MAG: hypothetical protein KIT58_15940, partial [Planctomycetota bacterium]|nr:hypothetical protein [Planctomycetota bacterium]